MLIIGYLTFLLSSISCLTHLCCSICEACSYCIIRPLLFYPTLSRVSSTSSFLNKIQSHSFYHHRRRPSMTEYSPLSSSPNTSSSSRSVSFPSSNNNNPTTQPPYKRSTLLFIQSQHPVNHMYDDSHTDFTPTRQHGIIHHPSQGGLLFFNRMTTMTTTTTMMMLSEDQSSIHNDKNYKDKNEFYPFPLQNNSNNHNNNQTHNNDKSDKNDSDPLTHDNEVGWINSTDFVSLFMIGSIQVYKEYISPLLLPACRFQPTCSQYGIQAIQNYGPTKGLILILWRLARCTPLGGKGYDVRSSTRRKKYKCS